MNNENYITKDFNLAGYLLSEGYKLIAHPKQNGITMFTFENDGSIAILLSKYYQLDTRVEPIKFGNSLRTLKSLIHQNANAETNNYVKQYKGTAKQ